MQISELLCRAEYIMRATYPPSLPLSNPLFPRLAPALDETLQLSTPPPSRPYPRQLHFAINLRYRTCAGIRRSGREDDEREGGREKDKLRAASWRTRLASLYRRRQTGVCQSFRQFFLSFLNWNVWCDDDGEYFDANALKNIFMKAWRTPVCCRLHE